MRIQAVAILGAKQVGKTTLVNINKDCFSLLTLFWDSINSHSDFSKKHAKNLLIKQVIIVGASITYSPHKPKKKVSKSLAITDKQLKKTSTIVTMKAIPKNANSS